MPLITNDKTHHAILPLTGTLDMTIGQDGSALKDDAPSKNMTKPMTYKRLGRSGLKVSQVILGCMGFGVPEWQGWVMPEEK